MEKDQAFQNFLEKITANSNKDIALQALQVKYEREIAGTDNDKQEEQLDNMVAGLSNIEKALTGLDIKIEFDPVLTSLENQTNILQKALEELSILRKVSEGSLEYDKESSQYRNISGREIQSDVSGKTIKKGGYIDFETASNRLAGQGKRVRESEANQLKLTPVERNNSGQTVSLTPFNNQPSNIKSKQEEESKITGFGNLSDLKGAIGSRVKGVYNFMTNKVEKKNESNINTLGAENISNFTDEKKSIQDISNKSIENIKDISNKSIENIKDKTPNPGVIGVNPDSDNIKTSQEVLADTAKTDLDLSKEALNVSKEQLQELKKIAQALAPSTPSELPGGKTTGALAKDTANGVEAAGPSIGLPDINFDLSRTPKGTPKTPPRPGGLGGRMMGGLRALAPVGAAAGIGLAMGGTAMYLMNKEVEQARAKGGDAAAEKVANEHTQMIQGAGDSTGALTTAITNANEDKSPEQIRKEQEAEKEKLKDAPWYTRMYGIGKTDYLEKMKAVEPKPVEGVSVEAAASARSSYAAMDPRRTDMNTSMSLNNTTIENNDLSRQLSNSNESSSSTPIISNNVSNNNTTSYTPIKSTPRPEYSGSALDRYQNRIAVF